MTSDFVEDPHVKADTAENGTSQEANGKADANGELSEEAMAELNAVVDEQTFTLNIALPHNLGKIKLLVHAHTSVHDIRQHIFDSPEAHFYTCFYFAFNGKRLNDLTDLADIEGFTPESELQLVEDVYNDREVRVHVIRLRELLTNFQPPIPTLGLDQAISYLPAVGGDVDLLGGLAVAPEKKKNKKSASGKSKQDTSGQTAFQQYSFDPADHQSISGLLPDADEQLEPCLYNLALSSWNPPPYHRRMAGDILYLTVTTLEKETVHITCSASGFYVNQSTGKDFDPTPRPKSCHNHTLPATLSRLSPLFALKYARLQDAVGKRHPYEYIMTATPSYPWLVRPRQHSSDSGRIVDFCLNSAEALEGFVSRDWNEDLQTARELPGSTPQERVQRDSAIAKAHADFVEAASRGVVSIINGSVPSMNPMDPLPQQMYLHNNIFFSQQSSDQFDQVGGKAASHAAVSKDVDGVQLVANLEVEGLHTLGTAVVDYKGHRIVAQTIIPGIFKKAPGADGSIEYGSVDSGKVVRSESGFHGVAEKVAAPLHLAEHEVEDGEGKVHKLWTSVESKGIKGDDGRRYLLDLYRVTPVDIMFQEEVEKEAETNPYPHKMTLLRIEMVDYFYEYKLREWLKNQKANKEAEGKAEGEKEGEKEGESEGTEEEKEDGKEANGTSSTASPETNTPAENSTETPTPKFHLTLNPDVFTPLKLHGTPESIKEQEDTVREASNFLNTNGISRLVVDLVDNSSNVPVDGEGLTGCFHRHGVNMRYLGNVAIFFEQYGELSARYFKALCTQEMVARAAKHILRELLEATPGYLVGDCVSHFLNCLFAGEDKSVGYECSSIHKKLATTSTPYANLTPSTLHAQIRAETKKRFRYEVQEDFYLQRRIPTLRSICLKVGIQLGMREYQWDGGVEGRIFRSEDVVNLYPVVKSGEPRAAFAEEALEHGRISLAQNERATGVELLKEAASIYEQIYGPIHPDTARPYQSLAMLSHQERDFESAKAWQRKALLVRERTGGFDDADTLQQYMNLAYFEYSSGNPHLGLKYMHHAMKLWEVSIAGGMHTDSASAYANIAAMLENLKDHASAVKFYEKAAEINETLLGKDNMMTILSRESLVKGYFLSGEYRKALGVQKGVYNYYREHLGEDVERTKEAGVILGTLTQQAVMGARKEKMDAAEKVKAKKPSTRNKQAAAAAAAAAGGGVSGGSSPGSGTEDVRSIEQLLKFIGEPAGVVGSAVGKKKRGGVGL
ncbi:Intracellular distribution of mitochondria [Rhizophlyctis rosea]|nr:Intracellular distribution of mitochondria [Rhizophlyctis rosea]